MKRQSTLRVETRPGFTQTAWLTGNGHEALTLLEKLGVRRQWDHRSRSWMFPASQIELVRNASRSTYGQQLELVEMAANA